MLPKLLLVASASLAVTNAISNPTSSQETYSFASQIVTLHKIVDIVANPMVNSLGLYTGPSALACEPFRGNSKLELCEKLGVGHIGPATLVPHSSNSSLASEHTHFTDAMRWASASLPWSSDKVCYSLPGDTMWAVCRHRTEGELPATVVSLPSTSDECYHGTLGWAECERVRVTDGISRSSTLLPSITHNLPYWLPPNVGIIQSDMAHAVKKADASSQVLVTMVARHEHKKPSLSIVPEPSEMPTTTPQYPSDMDTFREWTNREYATKDKEPDNAQIAALSISTQSAGSSIASLNSAMITQLANLKSASDLINSLTHHTTSSTSSDGDHSLSSAWLLVPAAGFAALALFL